jgi:hypothetical protein
VLSTLLAAFKQCRAFFDSSEAVSAEQLKTEFLNLVHLFSSCVSYTDVLEQVFFCTPSPSSDVPLTFRASREDDYLGSYLRQFILGSLEKREINLRTILESADPDIETIVLTDEVNPLSEWQKEEAALHWECTLLQT